MGNQLPLMKENKNHKVGVFLVVCEAVAIVLFGMLDSTRTETTLFSLKKKHNPIFGMCAEDNLCQIPQFNVYTSLGRLVPHAENCAKNNKVYQMVACFDCPNF